MRHALLLFALPLAACNGPGTNISIDAKSGDGNSAVTLDNGVVAIKGEGFQGTFAVPKINIDAADFDVNGVKLYPGSKISDFHLNAEDKAGDKDEGKVAVRFESPASLATVQSWFRERMTKQGFKFNDKGNGFAGTTDDGEAFTLDLKAEGDQKVSGRMEVGN